MVQTGAAVPLFVIVRINGNQSLTTAPSRLHGIQEYTPDYAVHPRSALEATALEAYLERKLTSAQLRCRLGFNSRYELDGFLRQREVWLEYNWQDLELHRETHRSFGPGTL